MLGFDVVADSDEMADDSESDYEEPPPPPVERLHCQQCDAILSERGMRVFLVAEPDSSLFSTDIPNTSAVREGAHHPIETCECHALALHCLGCNAAVGYHVLQPCQLCGSAEHNGHFWLFGGPSFAADCVRATPRENLTWADLPYNGAEADDASAAEAADASDDDAEQRCAVCLASPMYRPTRISGGCAHVFCFGCISREVDMRRCCPLDRRPVTREQLVAVTDDADGSL